MAISKNRLGWIVKAILDLKDHHHRLPTTIEIRDYVNSASVKTSGGPKRRLSFSASQIGNYLGKYRNYFVRHKGLTIEAGGGRRNGTYKSFTWDVTPEGVALLDIE